MSQDEETLQQLKSKEADIKKLKAENKTLREEKKVLETEVARMQSEHRKAVKCDDSRQLQEVKPHH